MVSDTPSQPPKNEKREDNAVTPADDAGHEAGKPPIAPEENDDAVKTAMADVAAAIKRQEDNDDESRSDFSQNTDDEDETVGVDEKADPASDRSNATTPPPPSADKTNAQKRGPGAGAFLAAGVAGGVIALAGAGALFYAGLLGPMASTDNYDSEISALRQEVDLLKSRDQSGAVSSLKSEIATLKSQVDSKAASSESGDISALQQTVSKLQDTAQSNSSRLQSLKSESDSLKNSLSSAQQNMQQQISTLEKKVNTPGKDLAVARAIAAAGLKSAIDRGQNFETELSTYAQVAPQSVDLAALQSLAASGIPTQEALTHQFSSMADDIIAAANQPPPDAGVFNRLVDSAKGLINVRPVGDVEGEGTPAIVARVENDLKQGDLKQAEQEWQTLPEDAKKVSADFEKALSARIKADQLVSQTLSTALGSTAGAPASAAQTQKAAPAPQAAPAAPAK